MKFLFNIKVRDGVKKIAGVKTFVCAGELFVVHHSDTWNKKGYAVSHYHTGLSVYCKISLGYLRRIDYTGYVHMVTEKNYINPRTIPQAIRAARKIILNKKVELKKIIKTKKVINI